MSHSTLPLYPSDDGWPYPDRAPGERVVEPFADDDVDLDRLELIADPHAWDELSPLERSVVERRFGFRGPPVSMRDLAAALGLTRSQTAEILGAAIVKLRRRLG